MLTLILTNVFDRLLPPYVASCILTGPAGTVVGLTFPLVSLTRQLPVLGQAGVVTAKRGSVPGPLDPGAWRGHGIRASHCCGFEITGKRDSTCSG